MDRKSEIAVESDVGGIKRCEFFFALGSFTCQVSVIRIKTETKGDIKGLFGYSWKLKTKKYCSKIIFKYVNSTVGPDFNEKVAEKWNLWVHEQCTMCTNWLKKIEKSNFAATVHWIVHEQ